MFQILAVLSPEPDASRSVVGFQAQMNTSDSWPLRTVALLAGISTPVSSSRPSLGLAVIRENVRFRQHCKWAPRTIGMHGFVSVRVGRLGLDDLRLLAVLELLLAAGYHVGHDGIYER